MVLWREQLEDYDSMPIGEFGMALMRGMGWKVRISCIPSPMLRVAHGRGAAMVPPCVPPCVLRLPAARGKCGRTYGIRVQIGETCGGPNVYKKGLGVGLSVWAQRERPRRRSARAS